MSEDEPTPKERAQMLRMVARAPRSDDALTLIRSADLIDGLCEELTKARGELSRDAWERGHSDLSLREIGILNRQVARTEAERDAETRRANKTWEFFQTVKVERDALQAKLDAIRALMAPEAPVERKFTALDTEKVDAVLGYVAGRTKQVRAILDSDPSASLAEHDAKVWDAAIDEARKVVHRRSGQPYETDIDLITLPNPYAASLRVQAAGHEGDESNG